MPTVLRALLLAALLTLVPIGIGVGVADDPSPPAPAPAAYEGTPLSGFDSAAAPVRRAPFCDLISPEAVAAALGEGAELTRYGNGETLTALPGGADVAHEHGCVFSHADGGEARGWVFVPPVTRARAAKLAAERPTRGCRAQPAAEEYGDPSVAQVCRTKKRSTATFRGLFGQAWLACSLTLPGTIPTPELLDTAGRWCVAVAQAASSPASATSASS